MRERKDELARLMALEMGKPLGQGRAEAEKCAWVCDYYAESAESFLRPEEVPTDASRSLVAFNIAPSGHTCRARPSIAVQRRPSRV